MTITDKQRARRKQGLGASDIAAIIGRDPFRSAYDLWLDKTGRIPDDTEGDERRFEVNNALEPAILGLAAKRLGQPVVKPTSTFVYPGGIIMANVDGMVERFARGQPIVEAKSTCMEGDWGEEMSDQVPDRVLIQVQMQMLCSGSKVAYVARLLSKFGFAFSMYRVPFAEELAVELARRADNFWQENVAADVAPEITPFNLPSSDLLGSIDRDDHSVELDPQVVFEYIAAKEDAKKAEKIAEERRVRLLAALGDAEAGYAPGYTVKYGMVKTCKVDMKQLEAAHPDIVDKFRRDGGYRMLLAKPVKQPKENGK